MVLSDRFLVAVKKYLDDSGADLPEVFLRDWDEEFPAMSVVLDVEEDPVEDEDVRGQFEIQASLYLRCQPSVLEAEREDAFELLAETLGADDDMSPDEWALVVWMRTEADRGIEPEELGIYEMLVGAGSWEVSDEEVTGKLDFTVLAISADLDAASFAV
jgi:hypothetical protein